VVWVVDSDGEFATTLPFRTGLPRPVVGDGGLLALAWHPRFDRFGAPQVTRRLPRPQAGRWAAHDWQLWMAGKALVAAAVGASRSRPTLRARWPKPSSMAARAWP
jgi:ABC transporter substrate binding protein (PQQ-dependent alcohol dehydrogenase system)